MQLLQIRNIVAKLVLMQQHKEETGRENLKVNKKDRYSDDL